MNRYKYIIMFACALLAGCSGSDEGGGATADSGAPVAFTTGVDATRSTFIDDLAALQALPNGFAVFAYNTESVLWETAIVGKSGSTYPTPDFMYNQPVRWELAYGTTEEDWHYTPLKYWPNTTNNATPYRYISFFAYAPYQETGLPSESDKEPHIDYSLGDVGSQVDLIYANCIDATRNGYGLIVYDGATSTYQKVPLTFHHALSAIDIYVQREYDGTLTSPAPYEADDTKIFVGKLQLTLGAGTTIGGKFNLYTGLWDSPSKEDSKTITFSNSDMMEWVRGTTATGASDIRVYELDKWDTQWKTDGTAYNELLDDTKPGDLTGSGVIDVPRRLVDATKTLLLIPQTLTLTPSLDYSFVTRDDHLEFDYLTDTQGAGGGNERRYARIFHQNQEGNSIQLPLEAGKRYHLLLHISAEHVSFEVMSVEDWDFPLRFTTSVEDYEKETKEHTVNEGH